MDLENIKYNEAGLVPAIVQDYETRQVLMMAWMNEEALKLTLDTKKATFYSGLTASGAKAAFGAVFGR